MSMYLLKIISLLGGLALFLFGMDTMGNALERQAGGRLQTILAKMSSTPLKGFLLGAAVTAIIQSSSATTVMVVGFVNSGIMTLQQTVGIIMGSNVGTTITSWIVSLTALEGSSFLVQLFKPATLAPLLGGVGIVMYLFFRSRHIRGIGTILLGFMTLMTGMQLMGDATAFLEEEQWFADLMISFSNPVLGILAGTVLTAVIQSSSASVGILQNLCATGAVTCGVALPIILGQNIGTCVTALISTIGANRSARRTAMVHLYFNIIGVVVFCLVFYGLGAFIPWTFLNRSANAVDIALIHTAFNLINTVLLLPASNFLVRLAILTVPDVPEPEKTELLDERLLATPAVAVQRAHEITGRMARSAYSALCGAIALTKDFDPKTFEQVQLLEQETDRYEDALGTYLVRLGAEDLATADNRILNTLLYSISDLERIADHACTVAAAAQEMADKKLRFSDQARTELAVLEQAVTDVMRRTVDAFDSVDLGLAMKIEPQEQVIDTLVREVKSRHLRRLRGGGCSAECGLVLEDVLNSYERIADHCSNIAVEMIQSAADKMEVHEYLQALKAGELAESELYTQRIRRYRAQYPFPDEH